LFQPGLKSHLERVKKAEKNKSKSKNSDKFKLEADSEGEYDDKFFDNSEGFKLIRKLILKLKQEVENNGSKLAVIHFPSAMQVHGYPNMPLDSFDDFLNKSNIPHLNLFPKYAAIERDDLIKTTLKNEHNDYHFSSYGHEVYAKFTMDFINSLLSQENSQ
jgi:hypothetical protein